MISNGFPAVVRLIDTCGQVQLRACRVLAFDLTTDAPLAKIEYTDDHQQAMVGMYSLMEPSAIDTVSDDHLWHIAVKVSQMAGGDLFNISQYECVTAIRSSFMNPDAGRTYVRERESAKVAMFDHLRNLMGFVQNGSDTTVTLSQDDATRSYHVKVGKTSHWGESFEEALMKHPKVEH